MARGPKLDLCIYLQLVPAPPPPTIGQGHRGGGGGVGQKTQQQQYRQSGRFLSVSFNEDNAAVSHFRGPIHKDKIASLKVPLITSER